MIIFISGIYGTGKSHAISKVGGILNIPIFDSSKLIKSINKEDYSFDKSVVDVDMNQQILIRAVNSILEHYSRIILTGHFCIFDKNLSVIELPLFVYEKLPIELFINLETKIDRVRDNLIKRDSRDYSISLLKQIQVKERVKYNEISNKLGIRHKNIRLKYDGNDYKNIISEIQKGCA